MQGDRIADPARLAGTVRGLGVCDVLRVELEPSQHAGLKAALTARVAELEAASELEQVRLLERMSASVPAWVGERFAFTGPAGLVLEIVEACLASALAAVAGEGATCSAELCTAGAWTTTALDCGAVETFCFEPATARAAARRPRRVGLVALGAAVLTDELAGPALADPETIPQVQDRSAPAGWAQKFPFAISFKACACSA